MPSFLCSVFAFLFVTFGSFAAPELSDRILVEKLHGLKELKVIRAAGGREEAAKEGDALFVGDSIVTAKGQIAQLSAFDKSSWAIAPESRLKLESRKPDQRSLFFWTFDLVKGSMWGEVAKPEPGKDPEKVGFRLKTKTKFASMGVRGTEYLLGGDEKLSTLDVLEGSVWWGRSADFAEGTFREVKAGEHAEMGPKGEATVRASAGDKAVLARLYGVVPGENAVPAEKARSMLDCIARGKGWVSGNGSSHGECKE